jgi:hypothetical protein
MIVQVSCPNCGYSREIPEEKIPLGARWATCSQCKHRFEFVLPETDFNFDRDGEGAPIVGQMGRGPTAWENRSEVGFWQGAYQTFKAVLFSPGRCFSTMAFEGGLKEPLAFGLLLGSIGIMFDLFWNYAMMMGGFATAEYEWMSQSTIGLIFLGIMIISPLFVAITIVIVSGILHLFLLTVRGGGNGFGATFRVISYSQSAQIFGLIPIIGGVIGGLWLLVVQVVGLREIHETSYARVIIAYLIPIALILALVMAIVISLFVLDFH